MCFLCGYFISILYAYTASELTPLARAYRVTGGRGGGGRGWIFKYLAFDICLAAENLAQAVYPREKLLNAVLFTRTLCTLCVRVKNNNNK